MKTLLISTFLTVAGDMKSHYTLFFVALSYTMLVSSYTSFILGVEGHWTEFSFKLTALVRKELVLIKFHPHFFPLDFMVQFSFFHFFLSSSSSSSSSKGVKNKESSDLFPSPIYRLSLWVSCCGVDNNSIHRFVASFLDQHHFLLLHPLRFMLDGSV